MENATPLMESLKLVAKEMAIWVAGHVSEMFNAEFLPMEPFPATASSANNFTAVTASCQSVAESHDDCATVT